MKKYKYRIVKDKEYHNLLIEQKIVGVRGFFSRWRYVSMVSDLNTAIAECKNKLIEDKNPDKQILQEFFPDA